MKQIVVLGICIIIMNGCHGRGNPIDAKKTEHIVPLQVGNMWKYTHILYDSVGKEGSRWTEQQTVFGDTLIEGEVWYQIDSSGITYFANRSNGLWKRRRELFYVGPPGDLQEPVVDVPFPIAIGDSIVTHGIYKYLLLERDVEVSVPAGTFSCYHYRVTLPRSLGGVNEYHRFYAINVGLVREDWSSQPDLVRDPYGARIISWYSGESLLSQVELY